MKIEREVTTTETVEAVFLDVYIIADEVEYDDLYDGDGRVPSSFKQPSGQYRFRVNIDTGIVADWPPGLCVNAHYKPRDSGRYVVMDAKGNIVADFDDDYVPVFLGHNDGGDDYLDFKVDGSGRWLGLNIQPDVLADRMEALNERRKAVRNSPNPGTARGGR